MIKYMLILIIKYCHTYPTLEAFLCRFRQKMTFGVLFGSRNRAFKAQEAQQFSISPSQLYQRILIHSGNSLIYGLPHFGRFSGQISMKNGVLGPFWVPECGSYGLRSIPIIHVTMHACIYVCIQVFMSLRVFSILLQTAPKMLEKPAAATDIIHGWLWLNIVYYK